MREAKLTLTLRWLLCRHTHSLQPIETNTQVSQITKERPSPTQRNSQDLPTPTGIAYNSTRTPMKPLEMDGCQRTHTPGTGRDAARGQQTQRRSTGKMDTPRQLGDSPGARKTQARVLHSKGHTRCLRRHPETESKIEKEAPHHEDDMHRCTIRQTHRIQLGRRCRRTKGGVETHGR